MDLVTVAEALPVLLKANIAPNLVGAPGIGKTSIINAFAAEGGHKLFRLNLGNQDVGDIIGLADFMRNTKGEAIATKFMMPQWALELADFAEKNPDRYAIVFLDEINRASRRDVLQAIFPLILEKRIHTTQLPPNTRIIAAMNPGNADDFVTELGEALLSRFCHLRVTTSLPSFLAYGKAKGLDERVLDFIENRPKMLCKSVEFSIPDRAPDQRAWEMISDLLKASPPSHLMTELLIGIVGTEAATAAAKFFSEVGVFNITAEEVLTKFNKTLAKRLTTAFYPQDRQPRMDLMSRVSEDIQARWCKGEEDKAISELELANFVSYVELLLPDTAFALINSLLSTLPVTKSVGVLDAVRNSPGASKVLKDAHKAIDEVKDAAKKNSSSKKAAYA